MISAENIQEIKEDLLNAGVDYSALQDELLDHIAIEVEQSILAGKDFKQAYNEVKKQFKNNDINFKEVQNDTKILLDYKSIFLKKLILAILAIMIIAFSFKTMKIPGGSNIQLLTFLLLGALFFKFAYHFYNDKRKKNIKQLVAFLFACIGILLPVTNTIYIFFSRLHPIATTLNMISYLLLSIAVIIYLRVYPGLNIFGIKKETRRVDLIISNSNVFMAFLSLSFYHFHMIFGLKFLLFIIVGVNLIFGLYYFLLQKHFTNRLISMLILSVTTMHMYQLVSLIRH